MKPIDSKFLRFGGNSLKNWTVKAFLFGLLFILITDCSKKNEIYYCPMHPTYTSDRPGTCPICNMDLVKKEEHSEHKERNDSTSGGVKTEEPIGEHSDHEGDVSAIKDSPELILSFEKQQSIGIKTELASRRNLVKKMNAYSNVAYDPDLYSSLSEYKEAIRSSEFLSESGGSIVLKNLQMRLRQLGLTTEQIRVWTSGQRDPSELILGGKSGRAHIYSQIYESEFTSVQIGLPIRFKTEVYPDKEFLGKIKSIDVILDKNSRTLRLRSEVSDPKQLLKPQMFGEAIIEVALPKILTVPTSAILDTGKQKIAYVQISPDKFRAVAIKTGKNIDSWTEIISGLEEGQRVVTESTFLIDSEARIRFGSNAHNH